MDLFCGLQLRQYVIISISLDFWYLDILTWLTPRITVMFSVLVLHWVTHQDDDMSSDAKTRCGECDRTIACRGDPYSISRGSNFGGLSRDHKNRVVGGNNGEVVTSIHAVKGACRHDKSIPLDGILTQTEVRRDIESVGGTSETEEDDPRVNSTDNIRQSTCSRP